MRSPRPAETAERGTVPAGWLVDIVAGPDAGRRIPVPGTGPVVIGRDPVSTVHLDDPAVSWQHAVADVRTRTVRVLDRDAECRLDRLDGAGPVERVADTGPWPDGAHLVIGSTRLALRRRGARALAAASPGPDGTLLVNRAPSLRTDPRGADVGYPPRPRPATVPPPPWALVLLPLLVAVPVALWWRQPLFAVLALLGPMLTLSQYLLERRRRRTEDTRARRCYDQECAERDAELAELRADEVRRRHGDHPDLALVAATVGEHEAGPGGRLWHRHAWSYGWLEVRLGLAELGCDIVTVRDGRRHEERLPSVPLTVDLAEVRVLGICGPAAARQAMARSLVGQLNVWTSPQQRRTIVLDQPDASCPQIEDGAGRDDPEGATALCTVVVLDDASTQRRRPEVARLLAGCTARQGGAEQQSAVVIAMAPVREQLPLECGATVELAAGTGNPGVLSVDRSQRRRFFPDLPGPGFSTGLAVRLARLRDATPRPELDTLARRVRLLDLVDAEPARIAQRWLAGDDEPQDGLDEVAWTVPLGLDQLGVWSVDLVTDGPHVLVAGTTGAGKSELLTSLLAALTVTASPQRLGLLLVDYKGGTAFGALAALPHVAGVVTDLDGAATRRVLTSLGAELRRRERLLSAHCQGERPTGPRPPRLVIVVDEFRVLAEEQPDVLAGLVRVATVGRGLGVHLVLATQRPAGVVSSQIRANTNLRIALRVRDAADSEEVIEHPGAARITAAQPGRALVRCGGGPVRTVQTGYLSAVDRERWLAGVQAAAHLLGRSRTPVPWLPELAERVSVRELALYGAARVEPGGGELHPDEPAGVVLPYALADLPEQQRRGVLAWDLSRDGQLAVVGGPGSGRTTLLRALAMAAWSSPEPVHVHVIDAAGALTGPGGLPLHLSSAPSAAPGTQSHWPGLGTVVGAADPERGRRLVALLLDEVARRIGAGPEPGRPHVLLLVDGWESLAESWSRIDHGRGVDDLVRLAFEGRGAGVHLAAAGGRSVLAGSTAGAFTDRLLLPTTDQSVLMLAGLTGSAPTPWPAGRVVALRRGSEPVLAQVARPDPGPASRMLGRHSAAYAGPVAAQPLRLLALPRRVCARSLPPNAIGLGGDDAAPVRFPRDGAGALVCGPPGSGRSTCLATLARALTAEGATVVRAGAASQVLEIRSALDRALGEAGTEPVLLLDTGWSAVPGLEELALEHLSGRWATGRCDEPVATLDRLRVVAAATATEVLLAHRGLLAVLRDHRCGLLLGPRSAGDGQALGVILPPTGAVPTGRGALVVRGGWRAVQLCDAPGDD